ncbi:MAG: septum formation initiator family protein [Chitinivibrionales bacterium]|nr:septum formation initiator family protein [Chitinivibrionales bacterium]
MQRSLKKRIIAGIVVAAGAGYFLLAGNTSVMALLRSQKRAAQSQADLTRSRATIDSLQIVIHKLKGDSAYIEGLAREKLGMAKSNETVYKFVQEATHK